MRVPLSLQAIFADCEGLIFDSDGVLVDSEVIHLAVERELLAECGLVYDNATYLSRFVGLSNADYHARLQADFAALAGGAYPGDFAERLHARTWPRIEAELQPMAGVRDVITAFGGGIAVASSAPLAQLKRKLAIAGLIELLEPHIYSADHVRNGKPAPDLFLHAANRLGVAPARCVVIEDSVHGVIAARAAGMVAIGFVGGGHADTDLSDRLLANGAHFVVTHHAELAMVAGLSAASG